MNQYHSHLCRAVLLAATTLLYDGTPQAGAANVARADPVAVALADVRDTGGDVFLRTSSVLGDLPTPAEWAALQPDFRTVFAAQAPTSITFSESLCEQLACDYTYRTLTGGTRSGNPFPLGITGAHIRDIAYCKEIVVVAVEPGSPADGVLAVDDVIVGANGQLFRDRRDPRLPLGYALYQAQTEQLGGVLTLQVVRAGKAMNAQVEIGVSGAYAPTWPYDCPRSERIADQMVRFVIDNEPKSIMSRHGGGSFWGPLFLMASGEPEALEIVRRNFFRSSQESYPEPLGGNSWLSAYRLVNYCEYYLLTGDSAALPAIRYHAAVLQGGQSAAGGWGHGCPCGGYGEVNNVGFVAFAGLALARECGVELDGERLAQTIRYFGRFIGGSPPYGDAPGGMRAGRMDNGMASMGSLAFKYLGEDDAARRWASTVCYMWMARERGHAEGIFNFGWGPQGAALASREEFHMFMNNMIWYYELARTREGGIHFMRGGHFPYPIGQTTAVGLTYLLPRGRIYMTGAPRSVFAETPPDNLAGATEAFKQKRWKQVRSELDKYLADTEKPHRDYAERLLDALNRIQQQAALSLRLAEGNLASGNTRRAREQLDTLVKLTGEESPAVIALRARLPVKDRNVPGAKHVEIESQTTLFAHSPDTPPTYEWEFILPPADEAKDSQKENYHVFVAGVGESPELGAWYSPEYEPTDWREHRGAIPIEKGQQVWLRRKFTTMVNPAAYKFLQLVTQNAQGEVYLNGYKLADVKHGNLYLRRGVTGVLKKGKVNVLAARLAGGGRAVDVALKAGPPVVPDLDDVLGDF